MPWPEEQNYITIAMYWSVFLNTIAITFYQKWKCLCDELTVFAFAIFQALIAMFNWFAS